MSEIVCVSHYNDRQGKVRIQKCWARIQPQARDVAKSIFASAKVTISHFFCIDHGWLWFGVLKIQWCARNKWILLRLPPGQEPIDYTEMLRQQTLLRLRYVWYLIFWHCQYDNLPRAFGQNSENKHCMLTSWNTDQHKHKQTNIACSLMIASTCFFAFAVYGHHRNYDGFIQRERWSVLHFAFSMFVNKT